MLNQAIIVGNLVRDPKVFETKNGQKIAKLTVATSRQWRDKGGEQKEQSSFHPITVLNSTTVEKYIEPYLKKGEKVLVVGELQSGDYEDKEGRKVYTYDVVVAGPRSDIRGLGGRAKASKTMDVPSASAPGVPNDDDIPW